MDGEDGLESNFSDRYKVFTLQNTIKKVIEYGDDKGERRVREIANWKLKSTENILLALLKNNMD
jgi:hypothetical protein